MTVIKINAITVAAGSGDELAKRFAARAGIVDTQEGFEGFELLAPTDDRDTWLVLTRWRDDAAFVAWRSSASFAQGHSSGGHSSGGERSATNTPIGMTSEVWSYRVCDLARDPEAR